MRGRPGLLRTILEAQETRGLTRSDDISRLLPSEVRQDLHQIGFWAVLGLVNTLSHGAIHVWLIGRLVDCLVDEDGRRGGSLAQMISPASCPLRWASTWIWGSCLRAWHLVLR